MAGGLLQLAAYGSENKYLMGNPQITFFKIVYKHHTNFSIESVEVAFSGLNNISEISQTSTTLRVKVPRVGDLLHSTFLRIKLPNIISSTYKKFKWVRNLGEVLIDSVSLYIGGNKIESFSGEWIHLYHNLTLESKRKEIYDHMTGNTPNLYDPDKCSEDILELISKYLADSMNNISILNSYNNSKLCNEERVKSSLDDFIISNSELQSKQTPYYNPKFFNSSSGIYPSILGRDLYVPLPFFFTKNIGLSLPLLALQYHDVEIEVKVSPIMNLFTILDNCQTKNLRRKPNPLREDHLLSYYVYRKPASPCVNYTNLCEEYVIQNHFNNNNYHLELSLELFYIFLDDLERDKFSKMSHEYLIEQVCMRNVSGLKGQSFSFDMSLYNPVKEMIWIFKRSDLEKYNIWFNYTNLLVDNNKPLHCQPNICSEYECPEKIVNLKYNTWEFYLPDILKHCKICFNSNDRLGEKNNEYFSSVQPFLHHTSHQRGIYIYSFSVEPERFQPSGAVNMSMIKKTTLEFETLKPPIDPEIKSILEDCSISEERKQIILNSFGIRSENNCVTDKDIFKYTYNLFVYVVNYNILKIVGGMGGLAYTN